MQKVLLLLIAACSFLLSFARKWTPEDVPMVHLQDARRYVCNPENVLSQAAVDSTDHMLTRLQRDKGIQTVVVVVKQIEGDDPYQFGMAIGKKYGVGSGKQRTGLIVVLATEDRSFQILTGNGLEGTLPDAICRRVQNRITMPALKEGKWDEAIMGTIRGLESYIRGDESLTADPEEDDETDAAIAGFILAAFLIAIISYAIYKSQKRYKCPLCKTRMREVHRKRLRINKGTGEWKYRVLLRCPKCGREKVIYEDDDTQNGSSTIPPIMPIGGGNSSGGFSGGSIGGSFGGGTFGGGGSGGRF